MLVAEAGIEPVQNEFRILVASKGKEVIPQLVLGTKDRPGLMVEVVAVVSTLLRRNGVVGEDILSSFIYIKWEGFSFL